MTNQIEDNVYESKDGRVLVTSIELAERFNKDHKNILRDIRENYQGDDEDRLNFEPIFLKDSYGRSQPAFEMTRDGFSILVMGFTGQEAKEKVDGLKLLLKPQNTIGNPFANKELES